MEQRNLVIAVVASLVILLGYNLLWEQPRQRARQAELERQAALTQQQQAAPAATGGSATAPTPGAAPATPGTAAPAPLADRATVLGRGPRIAIASPRLAGSISLTGGRVDDLTLIDYHETVSKQSPNIVLLSPPGSHDAYYVDYGWVSSDPALKLPGPDTVWQASGAKLTASQPVTLTWDNGEGLKFTRTFAVDDAYMFTVTQKVENGGGKAASLFPYARVRRAGTPKTSGYYILHEGPLAVIDGHLVDNVSYANVVKDKTIDYDSTGGWIGITDKYWLVTLIPDQKDAVKARFSHETQGGDLFQADFRDAKGADVAPGASIESTSRLFAGAKEVKLLDRYRDGLGIPLFDRAVDFGWFYFLTKPIFFLLDFLYGVVGNFGIAILLLTVTIKLLFLPLANRSYRAMSKMKALAPEMTKLRERYKEDKAKLNTEMMALYKREKVNPAAGCLPIVVQIPVFFSLYKVLFVTIEMRHAPFFGWIRDLSSPDPTSVLNLFGLLPWAVPDLSHLGPLHYLSIGIWPIIMGVTMFLQQKLNPAPPDPVQARIFMLLPVIFTFMLGQFAAGLVIYWAWNNLLSIAQQRFIMWRMGVKG
jgi:YidC/Oxa1 family membrane protein insertase